MSVYVRRGKESSPGEGAAHQRIGGLPQTLVVAAEEVIAQSVGISCTQLGHIAAIHCILLANPPNGLPDNTRVYVPVCHALGKRIEVSPTLAVSQLRGQLHPLSNATVA